MIIILKGKMEGRKKKKQMIIPKKMSRTARKDNLSDYGRQTDRRTKLSVDTRFVAPKKNILVKPEN